MKHKRAVLIVLAFTMGGSLYLLHLHHLHAEVPGEHGAYGSEDRQRRDDRGAVHLHVLQPVFGALSDRIGRSNNMLLFTALAVLTTVPLLGALGRVTSPYSAASLVLIGLVIASFYTSISGVVKAEMFPAEVRALGVGFTYAVGNAMFGGTAEYVALWFKSVGREEWFGWYVTILVGIALVAAVVMPDSRRRSYLDGTAGPQT